MYVRNLFDNHFILSLLVNSVSKENWFALLDNLVAATTLQQSQKKGRAFVALVTNEKHKMEQLTFDINDYKQQRHTKVPTNITFLSFS
jgi:hypothetical protein